MLDLLSIDSLPGREFRYHGVSSTVKAVSEAEQLIYINRDGSLIEKTYSDFVNEVHSHDAIFTKRLTNPINRLAINSAQKAEVERLEEYFFELNKYTSPTRYTQHVVDTVRPKINDTKPMSRATLDRRFKKWKQDGYDARVQVVGNKKSYPNRISSEIESFMQKCIKRDYLVREGQNAVEGYTLFSDEFDQKRYDPILKPSLRTYQRRINALPEYDVVLARKGKSEADKQFRTVKHKFNIKYPLDRVELDSAHFNIGLVEIIKEKTYYIGSVSIDLAFDTATASLLGYNVHIADKAEKSEYIISMLSHCINKKPDPDYIQYGLPRLIVKDAGTGYRSDLTEMYLDKIGCEYEITPTRRPWCKPFVERFVQTLRQKFFKSTDGYLGKYNPEEYTDLTLKQSAVLTVEQFIQKFTNFVREYHNTPLSRLDNLSPNQAWIEGTKHFAPMIPEDVNELEKYLPLKMSDRSLDKNKGLNYLGQFFNSNELSILRRKITAGTQSKNVLLDILVNPNDASSISVIVPDAYAMEPGRLQLLSISNNDVTSIGKSYSQIRAAEKGILLPDGALFFVEEKKRPGYGSKKKIGTKIDIQEVKERTNQELTQSLDEMIDNPSLSPSREPVSQSSEAYSEEREQQIQDNHDEVRLDD
jgi:hypothetical protein